MAAKKDDAKPPQFEISDLNIQPSDPAWPNAVRCVQMYWRQATAMNEKQRRAYLRFLNRPDLATTLGAKELDEYLMRLPVFWYEREGDILHDKLSWNGLLVHSALFSHLPGAYVATIESLFGTSVIQDHTEAYRRIYPELEKTKIVIRPTSSGHQANASPDQLPSASTQKKDDKAPASVNIASSQKKEVAMNTSTGTQKQSPVEEQKEENDTQVPDSQQQGNTPAQKEAVLPSHRRNQKASPVMMIDDTFAAPISYQETAQSAEPQKSPTLPRTVQSVEPAAWNINHVVNILSQAKKKRLSSGAESSP